MESGTWSKSSLRRTTFRVVTGDMTIERKWETDMGMAVEYLSDAGEGEWMWKGSKRQLFFPALPLPGFMNYDQLSESGGEVIFNERPKTVDGKARDVMEMRSSGRPSMAEDRVLIGMDRQMKQVKNLMAAESRGICIIPMRGMGGVGKSMLAECVYHSVVPLFDGCCFLRDFTDEQLEQELLSMRSKGYNNKNVLILLDGVTKTEQIDLLVEMCDGFGAGTRILVPTRDTWTFSGCESNVEQRTYNVEPLARAEAHELLLLVAFDGCTPPNSYADLIDGVLDYAEGNPLAVKELGKFLYGRGETQWRDALKKLTKFPNYAIHDVLMSSYDALDDEKRAIFLDVAFFFRGERLDHVTDLLNACGLDATNGIAALVERSLVYVKDGCLGMHPLHAALAREAVRRESPKDPTLRSRLSSSKDVLRVLGSDPENGPVKARGLYMDMADIKKSDFPRHLKPDAFSKMSDLKFIIFCNSACSGGCGDHTNGPAFQGLNPFPPSLRLLSWHGYPLSCLPDTSNLSGLRLACSAIESNRVSSFAPKSSIIFS